MRNLLAIAYLAFLSITAYGQGFGVIPVQSSFHRVYAIVPLVGAGTFTDPVRPMYAPTSTSTQQQAGAAREAGAVEPGKLPERTGIIAYSSMATDDGRMAIVEFVGANRLALREIIESRVPGVQVFELGRASNTEIEAAFRRVKREFDLSSFQTKVR